MSTKYVFDYPNLMLEWNWEKNNALGLDPHKISYGSAIKVWWVCECGREWEASPNHRSRGRGCPTCSEIQRRITRQRNIVNNRGSLADNNPELAEQWHPTKNGELKPTDVTVNSSRRVWWICKKQHEWDAPINSRNTGVGCPVCSGYRVVPGINDLATTMPELAAQWHPSNNGKLTPNDVIAGTDRKVWWLCEKGHDWEATISNRANGTGCPVCANKQVRSGINDLATTAPQLALEWHPTKNGQLTPQDITAGSNKKVWWQCEKGHEWATSVVNRSKGTGCPHCQNEYRTSFPEQAICFYFSQTTVALNRYMVNRRTEIDVFLPEHNIGIEYDGVFFHVGAQSEQREKRKQEELEKRGILLFRVKESKEIKENQAVGNVVYCHPGQSDADLTHTINMLLTYINQVAHTAFCVDVDVSRDRIKILEQFVANEKSRSLAEVNPEVSAQWHPTKNGNLLPTHFSASSNRKAWWLCGKGHEWEAVINSRRDGVGCPYCAGKRVIKGETDLSTVNPDLAQQWNYERNGSLTPFDVTIASNRAVWWRCEKGHEWKTAVWHRTKGGNCPVCSGKKVLAGYNDLATVNPVLAAQWHPTKNTDIKPTDVTFGSDKKVWWLCNKGHEWQAVISSREKHGCPYCAGVKSLVKEIDITEEK